MVFEFENFDSLPQLAWCAHIQHTGVVRVRHGSAVEVCEDAFVEGAWDGEFSAMAFDDASTLAGSGGRLRNNSVVFSSPFHPLECLYLVAAGDRLLVSNSLTFLFVEANDRPDIHYNNYFFDLLRHARHGVPNLPIGLPTEAGARIQLFQICNLQVDSNLSYRERPKALPAPPTCFSDYDSQLVRTVTAVARNAAAPQRKRTYRLVSAVSTGYDSTASTAVVSRAGGREAVTFTKSSAEGGLADDRGTEIATCLGMTTTEYERSDVRNLPGFPEAEFWSKPSSSGAPGLAPMESQLEGALFTTGRHGEDVWGRGRDCKRPGLREPENATMPGRGVTDFRVRVGYLNFPVPYIGALHGSHVYLITHSPEMKPWTLGVGAYDRPIARRLVEEAGVPRDLFGQRKLGGGGRGLRTMNAASDRDFHEFCRAEVAPYILQKLDQDHGAERFRKHFRMLYIRKRLASQPITHPFLEFLPMDRWHVMWNSIYLYTFHWGFGRISPRYRI